MTGYRYPNAHELCFAISVASGHLNRFTNEVDIRNIIAQWIDLQDDPLLDKVDSWLGTLSKEQLATLADGDEADARVICENAPEGFEKLYSDFFEEPMW